MAKPVQQEPDANEGEREKIMNHCTISFETLMDYRENRLGAAVARRVRQHVIRGCAACQERLAWMEAFLPALHAALTMEETPVPAGALTFARNIARERPLAPPPVPEQPTWIERLARVLFDSRQTPALAGARGQSAQAFRMVFGAENCHIDLWAEWERDGPGYLIGQIVPRDGSAPLRAESVTLTAEDGRLLAATWEANEFHIAAVPAGTYMLRIRRDGEEIIAPDVRLYE